MDLSTLNDMQRKAVEKTDGPLLLLAGAGSGKTRVLTHRIAYLIEEKGIYPGNILAITFTNKAAAEMKERVESLIGALASNMWISTFHSACVRILRRDIDKIGYTKDFVIYDTTDQKTVIKDCLKELNLSDEAYPVKYIQSVISDAKDKLITPEKYSNIHYSDFKLRKVCDLYNLYQKKLKSNNAMDFDDLIMKTIELFETAPEVLDFYQKKFQYIMVDEYQDTNRAQYKLINMLSKRHRNLCVVGDDDQCLIEGSYISTNAGNVKIEDINENHRLICASGRGEVLEGAINKKIKKHYEGPVVKIRTKSGREIVGTPNHIGFASLNPQSGVYYVYLMYKSGMGYRIGQTQGVRSRKNGDISNGLAVRLNQEHADKVWIIKVCFSKDDAAYYEQLYAFKYGIPTTVFHSNGRKTAISQENIDKIFNEIDTEKAAIKLMDDLMLFEEYPHHIPNAVIRGQSIRRIVNINAFAGPKTGQDAGWCSHRISFNTTGEDLRKMVSEKYSVRNGNRNKWRVETERKDYDEAQRLAKELAQFEDSIEILKRARLIKEKSYNYIPLSHIKPSMSIAILENGKIVEDIVEDVTIEEYIGNVYDLSVPHFRNYICNGIVVHNSIYGWRGADIRNILDFEKDFPDTTVIKLEQNYRSTKTILEAANRVIKKNIERKSKRLWTSNGEGKKIRYFKGQTERDEAGFIAGEILHKMERDDRPYSDFAVLYRTNAQSRVIEDAFMKNNIPYKIVGGLKFYDRKEIKDILAYLRIILNPLDDVSLLRIINTPKRGIGNRTLEKLGEVANARGEKLFSVLLDAHESGAFSKRVLAGIDSFLSVVTKYIQNRDQYTVTEIIKNVLDETGYIKELEKENTIESRTRIENLQEFISVAMEFEMNSETKSLEEFLAEISLTSDIDNLEEDQDSVVLMTLHSAKGLEFPVVFLAGMEDGIFPGSRALMDDNDLEEERRLCYVGITRAKEELYLTHAFMRTLYGRTNMNPVSRFIDEIPAELIEDKSKSMKKGIGKHSIGNNLNKHVGFKERKIVNDVEASEIRPGTKVEHKMFGNGTVISVKGSGENAELTIAFDKKGVKKLMLGYSPIKII
ncbi:MAG: ATP-dependent helicase UvrD/PcrA [Candidatus Petromonas sp.]|jgi:DNA helicase-2/ATP-dependent DNA helicase PcrA|nr:ATP-dependent helicase UvrD/PcrA [Candidatus Petromonas sp.]